MNRRALDVTDGRPLVIRPEYQHTALLLLSYARKLKAARIQLAESVRMLQAVLEEDANGVDHGLRRRAQRVVDASLLILRETATR